MQIATCEQLLKCATENLLVVLHNHSILIAGLSNDMGNRYVWAGVLQNT